MHNMKSTIPCHNHCSIISGPLTTFISIMFVAFLLGCHIRNASNNHLVLNIFKEHFPPELGVVISNQTGHAVRVWKEDNSWGWYNLSLEFKNNTDGKITKILRRQSDFTMNLPSYVNIEPHASLYRTVNIADGWWSLPTGLNLTNGNYQISAQLLIRPSREAGRFNIFVGETRSDWQ